jgi:hypothetical protein
VLQAEVAWTREVVDAAEDAHATVVYTAETSARESTAAWYSATLRVKDAEDWATLSEREALEWVFQAEVENAIVLASAREDAEGLA